MKHLWEVAEPEEKKSLYLVVEIPAELKESLIPSVQEALPDIEIDQHPAHITLVFLGDSYEEGNVGELIEACKEAVDVFIQKYTGSKHIWMERMSFFKASSSSKNRTPIICKVRSDYLQALNAVLTRASMPYSTQKQFVWYEPHVTIGFLMRDLSKAEQSTLSQIHVGSALATWTSEIPIVLYQGDTDIWQHRLRIE